MHPADYLKEIKQASWRVIAQQQQEKYQKKNRLHCGDAGSTLVMLPFSLLSNLNQMNEVNQILYDFPLDLA